jgi:phenylalanyl-tRNA synthetase beta chain
MKINLNWITDYVETNVSVDSLAEKLTMSGFEIESIQKAKPRFQGVIVGKVLTKTKHPKADKLSLCTVNVGERTVEVVCGAPNVAVGQLVPVALPGALLGNGLEIKPAVIRGIASEGMICSQAELGVSDNHDGIWVLDSDSNFKPGNPFEDKVSDVVFDVNVTPNRPDCLSHIGIAREIGAVLNRRIHKPDDFVSESAQKATDSFSIEILDPSACPRYSARIIRNVTIGPSPDWLRKRLESVGIRSINTIVDATNYVMMETGQPLHAFDLDLLSKNKISVRLAKTGEFFTTLDGKSHSLESGDLLICDGDRGVALAGVMGGENSEVSVKTRNILLESAYFNPQTIRRTAKRLGFSTEASQRMERGVDPNGTIYAANRAARLIHELAGGEIAQGCLDVYPAPIEPRVISLRIQRIAKVLGVELTPSETTTLLSSLELEVKGTDSLTVTVPTFRPDLKDEIDLIEEIARLHGFNQIPPSRFTAVVLDYSSNPMQDFVESLRDSLVGMGCFESINHSMVSNRHVGYDSSVQSVTIQNPISPDMGFMRVSLIPGLIDTVRWNKNRFIKTVRLFEIGHVFHHRQGTLPEEPFKLGIVLSGSKRTEPFWNEQDAPVTFYHLKGLVESLFKCFHLNPAVFKDDEIPSYNDLAAFGLWLDGEKVGSAGELDRTFLKSLDVSDPVWAAELDIDKLFYRIEQNRKYSPIPRFPSVKRDLSIVVKESIPAESLLEQIRKSGGSVLFGLDIFDLYRGNSVPQDKKSMTFALTFQSHEKTLTEEDVDPIMTKIVLDLVETSGAALRS